jgi:hypothetical protein
MNHETWKCAGPELERQIRCFLYREHSDVPGSVRPNARSPYYLFALIITYIYISGADTGFKVRGAHLKKVAPSGGRRENFLGISCEKSRFYAKKSYFFQF